MEAQNQNVVTALCENARFLYNNNIFNEDLVDAEIAYRLGETNMLDLIVKCNQILTESLPVAVPVFKILECHATMDVEYIHVDIFKPELPPPPKDDPDVSRIIESANVFTMLNIPYPTATLKESYMGKLLRKMFLKVHPDKCSDQRASVASAKLSAAYREYLDNPPIYISKYAPPPVKQASTNYGSSTAPDMSKFKNYYSRRNHHYAEHPAPKTEHHTPPDSAPRRKFHAANEDPSAEPPTAATRNSKGHRKFGGK